MLFDKRERNDPTPQGHVEDSFAFLNRVASPYWDRVRKQLDEWYLDFPDTTGDLRKRIRSPNPRQHYPAWWELYVFALFRALGFTVTPHPNIAGCTGRPDFLMQRGAESFYVEAAAVFSGIVSPGRNARLEAKIMDILDGIPAPDVMAKLEFTQLGQSTPRRQSVTTPVRNWLASLDPADLLRGNGIGTPARFAFGDWVIELTPIARLPQFRGCPDNKLLATHGVQAGYTDDADKLRNAIKRKGRRYGTPDRPLVVAVLAANGFVGEHEIVSALFGSEQVRVNIDTGETTLHRASDGVWVGDRGPAAKRISAVMLGTAVLPASCATREVRIWHHFEPNHRFACDLPLPSARVDGQGIQHSDGSATPAEILGLPPDWPGPDPPFVRCAHGPRDHGATA